MKTGGDVVSSPALGDVDGDGKVEVVVGSWDHYVWALNYSGAYDPSFFPWPMFRHDERRTGLYPPPARVFPWIPLALYLTAQQSQQANQFILLAAGGAATIAVLALAVVLWRRRT
ncbi:MAG: hypothetical protein ACTSUQ_05665 [Candidatus Freyarchaeota archaeon]